MHKHVPAAPLFGLAMCFVSSMAFADEAPFSRKVAVKATVISTDLLETVTTEDIEIKSRSVLDTLGQLNLSVNEHYDSLEIVEAATVKPDGRRIPVAADKILVSTLPTAPQRGIFRADVKVRTIVFPEVSVGDTLHYVAKIRNSVNPLPGGFQLHRTYQSSARFDSAEISIDAPEELQFHEFSSGFSRKVTKTNGRKQIVWTKEPQPYRTDEPGATAPNDRDPRVQISSYADNTVIGRKFFEEAALKSEPTPEIRAFAGEITNGITDRREQARAIFDWVTKNVRYMAIFLGDGGWVPNEARSILAMRYGDCKDHATLMRALLAAKGIDADYVLISLTPTYRTDVPAGFNYNHVILYLPEFDVYTDPTATVSSFGQPPESEADKPVLRMGKNGVLAARTPALDASTNRVRITADVSLRADGTPAGKTQVEASGPIAASLRRVMSLAASKGGDVIANEQLSKHGWHGTGKIEPREATDHRDPYVVATSFDLTNRFFGNGSNKNAIPVGPQLLTPMHAKFVAFIRANRTQDFVCEAGTYEQIIDVHLPAGQSLTRVPPSVSLSAPLATYHATYSKTGQTLHIKRRFVSKVPGQVCTAQIAREISPVAEAALRDFGTRLNFGHGAADDPGNE